MANVEDWQRIEALFQAALDRPPRARARFLDEACGADGPVRRAVDALLDADTTSPSDLDESLEGAIGAAAVDWTRQRRRLLVGSQLGRYRLDACVASGGMGEVYKAHDDRLDRPVAIKVIAPWIAASSAARERLEREAKAIAALSDPHICRLYDICSADGVDFLVMEYLDGETLATRLRRGALPLREALMIAAEIAGALDRAHRAGVVHRDLKPGNIMLTRSGAKLLDFGIASLHPAPRPAQISRGVIPEPPLFGTIRYMAPEQLRGVDADWRADIWAFGCVLYEMLAGIPLFTASDSAALTAAITGDGAILPFAALPDAPAALRQLLGTCLARDREERWQSAGDLRRALAWSADRRQIAASATSVSVGNAAWLRPAGFGLALAWAIVVGIIVAAPPATDRLPKTPVVQATTRLRFELPPGVTVQPDAGGPPFALSHDGRRVAYVGVRQGQTRLYVQPLDADDPVPLAGTDHAVSPVFSPDGESLAFAADGEVKQVAFGDGTVTVVGAAPSHPILQWTADNHLLVSGDAAPIADVALHGRPPRTGAAEALDEHDPLLWPTLLDDGRSVLFTRARAGGLGLLRAGESTTRRVLDDALNGRVWRDMLLFGRRGALWAAPFDVGTGAVRGQPRQLASHVLTADSGMPLYAIADDGTVVYAADRGTPSRALVWIDRAARERTIAMPARAYRVARISPDGARIAASAQDGGGELWVGDAHEPAMTRLTAGAAVYAPVWAPDGRTIYYSNQLGVLAVASDASADPATILEAPQVFPTGLTPDGRTLLVDGPGVSVSGRPGSHLGRIALAGDTRILPLVVEAGNQHNGVISPDGRWLAYESDGSGRPEIFVRPFPDVDAAKWKVSIDGGAQPLWSQSGRELFYRGRSQRIVAVRVTASRRFAGSAPEVLAASASPAAPNTAAPSYDVSPDGRRFLTIRNLPGSAVTQLTLLMHWDEDRVTSATPTR